MRLPVLAVLAAVTATVRAASNNASGSTGSFSWPSTKYMISFGDSYSDNTGWGNFLAEPPHWSHFSDGPNWVDYLESTYNESTIALRSTAFGGATINSTLITALGGAKTDIVTQVERFQELLTPAPASTAWTSADTLFTMWVGINDITVTYSHNNQSQLHATLMDSWYNLQATLYKSGARNFLYLNVPPFYRAPWFNPYPANRELLKAAIEDYNVHLLAKAKEFQRNYPEAFVLHFDAYTEFGGLLDKATEFGFRNVTDYCDEYAKGTANLTTLIPSCVNPVNEYFWTDWAHPTWPVHKLLAAAVKELLANPVSVGDSSAGSTTSVAAKRGHTGARRVKKAIR